METREMIEEKLYQIFDSDEERILKVLKEVFNCDFYYNANVGAFDDFDSIIVAKEYFCQLNKIMDIRIFLELRYYLDSEEFEYGGFIKITIYLDSPEREFSKEFSFVLDLDSEKIEIYPI